MPRIGCVEKRRLVQKMLGGKGCGLSRGDRPPPVVLKAASDLEVLVIIHGMRPI